MTEAERTPGPWETVLNLHDEPHMVFTKGDCIADLGGGSRHLRDDRTANARFIAAAPDMEKALETWLEWDGEIGEGPSPPMLARAALAKARGL